MVEVLRMTRIQIPGEVPGAALLVMGLCGLWVRSTPDRNRVSRAVYWLYQKITFGVSVDTYLLVGGIAAIVVGSLLLFGPSWIAGSTTVSAAWLTPSCQQAGGNRSSRVVTRMAPWLPPASAITFGWSSEGGCRCLRPVW